MPDHVYVPPEPSMQLAIAIANPFAGMVHADTETTPDDADVAVSVSLAVEDVRFTTRYTAMAQRATEPDQSITISPVVPVGTSAIQIAAPPEPLDVSVATTCAADTPPIVMDEIVWSAAELHPTATMIFRVASAVPMD